MAWSIEQVDVERLCGGTFIDLRKAFFLLRGPEAPLMFSVVIVQVSDGKRCFLVRQSFFPLWMYTALAGICDTGEPMEETLRKEIAEDVGLESIPYSGSQHWPFPQSSFMMACHAAANPEKTQIKAPPWNNKRGFWVPPSYAIANRLNQEWTDQQPLKSEQDG
ncbi:nucleoside diphosphate-linked moiety X motif 13-like [Oncorhynchus mykiss]|uniref:nucleoside diphosphate-linked moiety X motif 13-like n=1 Tax=Oncorhynchus mykiss TaxID=8022 RepID=UPI0018779AD6|nr:nucleoside diphosphate-linked moiety X motif 13-like [Oncorhynchus mykiss]